jgi:hypothetical protein
MALALYPTELRKIADIVETYQNFNDMMNNVLYDGTHDVSGDWEGELSIVVYDINGKTLGTVNWTDDGVIGFTVAEPEEESAPE